MSELGNGLLSIQNLRLEALDRAITYLRDHNAVQLDPERVVQYAQYFADWING